MHSATSFDNGPARMAWIATVGRRLAWVVTKAVRFTAESYNHIEVCRRGNGVRSSVGCRLFVQAIPLAESQKLSRDAYCRREGELQRSDNATSRLEMASD
jgi:hypothetical protein